MNNVSKVVCGAGKELQAYCPKSSPPGALFLARAVDARLYKCRSLLQSKQVSNISFSPNSSVEMKGCGGSILPFISH